MLLSLLRASVCFLALATSGFAQCGLEELLASDGGTGDRFGVAVGVDGDVAIVGANFADDSSSNAGSAYIYRFDGTSWNQEAELHASSPGSSYHFGQTVAISGDVAVVGVPDDDDLATRAGSVYVFRYDGVSSWDEEQQLSASDWAASDRFGWSVAIDGDVIAVGAKFDDDTASDSGSAYVFRWSGATWDEEDKLNASDAMLIAQFGDAIAVDGSRIVVGAWQDGENGTFSGAAYVYDFSGIWVETAKLSASDAGDFEWFGRAVDVAGDLIVVGAYAAVQGADEPGAAYVFRKTGTWMEEAILTGSDVLDGERLGWSVALTGGRVAAGAYQTSGSAGAVYLFDDLGGGSWSESARLHAIPVDPGGQFGYHVAAGGGRLIAGAWHQDTATTDSGAAYVFTGVGACNLGVTYCRAAANGVSAGGSRISASGSTSIAANDLVLSAGPMTAGEPGIFFYGDAVLGMGNGLPFGDGFRCVGGSVVRLLPPSFSDGAGTLTRIVDNTTNTIASGLTFYFQAWYRDPAGPLGSSFNLSNALCISFQP